MSAGSVCTRCTVGKVRRRGASVVDTSPVRALRWVAEVLASVLRVLLMIGVAVAIGLVIGGVLAVRHSFGH
jgi:hypothetical protein